MRDHGAGEGNRTLVASLGSWSSAIELHPHGKIREHQVIFYNGVSPTTGSNTQELADGRLKQENGKAKVELVTNDGVKYPQGGTLEFSDVTVDQTTGSITLRAIFPNPDHTLLPGMFVRARLEEGVNPDALLVPQQGVTRTPRGDASVMVVGEGDKVEVRQVTATQAIGDKWLVTEGLKTGDRVIVTGLQKIKPGVQVKAQEVASDDKQQAAGNAPSEQTKS